MKEKETREIAMTEFDGTPSCARAEDLVSYLYGEADAAAARSFEAHMQHCDSCQTELSEFGQVRTSIGEWRGQALGSLPSTATATSSPVIAAPVRPAPERQRSALVAIREFFSLSPLWMRAATATLAVVFCALVALAVAHYFEQPKTITVERLVPAKPSQAELDEMVAARLKQLNEANPAATEGSQRGPAVANVSAPKEQPTPKLNRVLKPNAAGQSNLAGNRTPQLKISPQESREIARDLRLVASNDEEDLPRLSDLIDESN
jgi:hypothetical protein